MSISAISGSTAPDYTTQTQATHRHTPPTNMIDGTRPGGPGGAGGPAGTTPPSMSNTASLLGISTDTLSSDLQSGQTVSSLASSAGVSSSDLLSAVEQDMSANAPSAAGSLSSDQLTQMATDFIDGVQPGTSTAGSDTAGDVSYVASGTSVSNAQVSGSLYDVFA
jgi:hypothetical protein